MWFNSGKTHPTRGMHLPFFLMVHYTSAIFTARFSIHMWCWFNGQTRSGRPWVTNGWGINWPSNMVPMCVWNHPWSANDFDGQKWKKAPSIEFIYVIILNLGNYPWFHPWIIHPWIKIHDFLAIQTIFHIEKPGFWFPRISTCSSRLAARSA